MGHKRAEIADDEWVRFPGGELEGKRPRALCPRCREALQRDIFGRSAPRPPSVRRVCFLCYRAELDRERALEAAGRLDTGSEARFQAQLPLEPVDRARLATIKATRAEARASTPPHVDRRRRAQIDARKALQQIAAGLKTRGIPLAPEVRERALFTAVHAAELQLPEAWLPFVVSRSGTR